MRQSAELAGRKPLLQSSPSAAAIHGGSLRVGKGQDTDAPF